MYCDCIISGQAARCGSEGRRRGAGGQDLYLLCAPDIPWVADGVRRSRAHARRGCRICFAPLYASRAFLRWRFSAFATNASPRRSTRSDTAAPCVHAARARGLGRLLEVHRAAAFLAGFELPRECAGEKKQGDGGEREHEPPPVPRRAGLGMWNPRQALTRHTDEASSAASITRSGAVVSPAPRSTPAPTACAPSKTWNTPAMGINTDARVITARS